MILPSLDASAVARTWAQAQAIMDVHEDELAYALKKETQRFLGEIEGAVLRGEPGDLTALLADHERRISLIFNRHMEDTSDSFGTRILRDADRASEVSDWRDLALASLTAGVALSATQNYAARSLDQALAVSTLPQAKRGSQFQLLRFNRIDARTRGAAAAAEVHLASQTATDVSERMWMSRLDGRERAAHNEAHGQIVSLSNPYMVGGHLMRFPGDFRAPFALWKNCRCASALILEKQR